MSEALRVTDAVEIPRSEITIRATRSGGPGGQHVNTSSTRVEVFWNVRTTAVLGDEDRERVLTKLGKRVSADGWLRVVSSESRSQLRNRESALAQLGDTVRRALAVPRTRKRTRLPAGAREARLKAKKRRSLQKRMRGRQMDD